VGILLGVSGPKHGDPACSNYAIGQGDNGNNTKLTLERRGLMPLFQKYKGKQVSPSVTLSEVEDEIVAAVPEYQSIREQFHVITGQAESGIQVYEQRKAEPAIQTAKVFSENKSSGNRNIDDKKLKFASHSERIMRERFWTGKEDRFFNEYGEECGGSLYLSGRRYGQIIKVGVPDGGDVTVIKSDSKYFEGEIAVNCHGIFRRPWKSKAIYLFDESGNLKTKVSLKENKVPENNKAPRVYIYDNFIYEMCFRYNDLTLYRHDIGGGEAERIWSYLDYAADIRMRCEEYLERTNADRELEWKKEFQLGSCVRFGRLCANDRYVIVEVNLGAKSGNGRDFDSANCMNVLLQFDLHTNKTYVLHVAYIKEGKTREDVDFKVLAVDMDTESVCLGCPSENGDFKCIEKHIEENGVIRKMNSYIIPKGTIFYYHRDIAEHLKHVGSDKIAYIAGKSVLVGIYETMNGYIYRLGDQSEGNPRNFSSSYQSSNMETYGDSYVYYGMNNDWDKEILLNGTESPKKGLRIKLESMKAEAYDFY
jgi:hypothetical protein